MDFESVSRRIFYLGVAIWVVLAAFKLIPQSTLMLILGILVAFLGLKNLIILYQSRKHQRYHRKLAECIERMGHQQGLIYYAFFMVAIFIIAGFLLVFLGLNYT